MPCTRAVKTAVFTVHGRVRAAYTAVIRSRTDHVRGPCTAVYTVCTRPWAAVYTGRKHGRVLCVPCTRPWTHYVHGRCTPVYTVRTRRERPSTPPCTRAVNTAVYTAVNTALYTVTDRPCTWPVHGRVQSLRGRGRPCTDCARPLSAVYKLRTRPYMGHAHGPSVSRTRPCTQPVRGKTRPGTRPVPDRVRTVYMAVHGPCAVYRVLGRLHGRLHGPCARPCTYHVHGRAWSVHDPNTAVYTVVYPVHGRVYGPCTRPCTVYMPVFVACVYGRPRPCTDCVRAMYMVRS